MFEKDVDQFLGVKFRETFISRICEGFNLAETCALLHINPAAMILARQNDPAFDNTIRLAQSFRADMLVDKLENIEDYEENPMMARVISDNIKWLASRRNRQIYGDKVEVNHNHIIDIRGAIEAARQRTLADIDAKPLNTLPVVTDRISVTVPELACIDDDIDPLS